MKKIFLIMAITFVSLVAKAQNNVPTPGTLPERDGASGNPLGIGESAEGPVGTATLLMLGMGGAYMGYKVKKNKKKEE